MRVSDNRLAFLSDLLKRLFESSELKRWLESGPDPRPSVAAELPWTGVGLASLVHDAARALDRRGLIDNALFTSLLDERPKRREEIAAVAALWGQNGPAADRPAISCDDTQVEVGSPLDFPPPVRAFTARDEVIGRIEGRLHAKETVLVAGPPGMGKTQVALALASRWRERGLVAVLRAETTELLIEDLCRLSIELGLGLANGVEHMNAARQALARVSSEPDVLLVYDNAESFDAVRILLPPRCAVLITARHGQGWGSMTHVEVLGPLGASESLRLMLELTGDDDRTSAEALVAALGGHPLALTQTCGWCNEQGLPLRAVLQRISEDKSSPLDHMEGSPEYPELLPRVLNMCLEGLDRRSVDAGLLLRLLCFWAPDDVPGLLLAVKEPSVSSELRSLLANRPRMDDARRHLARSGLVHVRSGGYAMHRLVQAVLSAQLPAARANALRLDATVLAAVGLRDAYVAGDFALCWRVFPHALTAAQRLQPDDLHVDHIVELVWHLMDRFTDWGMYESGLALSELFVDCLKASFGYDPRLTLLAHNQQGVFLQKIHNFEAATKLFQEILPIAESTFGEDDALTVRIRHNLGFVLMAVSPQEARVHLEAALEYRAKHGSETDIAHALASLGQLLLPSDPIASQSYYEEAVRRLRREVPPGVPTFILALLNLATACLANGRMEEAEGALAEAEANSAELRLACHPHIHGLDKVRSQILTMKGDLPGAAQILERMLNDMTSAGLAHTLEYGDVLHDLINLGCGMRQPELVGRGLAALHEWEVAHLDGDGPRWETVVNRFSNFTERNLQDEARQTLYDDLRILRRRGEHRPDFLNALMFAAKRCYELENFAWADELYQWVIEVETERTGPRSPERAFWLNGWGSVKIGLGQQQQATPLLREALEIVLSDHANADVLGVLPEVQVNLGTAALMGGDLLQAKLSFEEALRVLALPAYASKRALLQQAVEAQLAHVIRSMNGSAR